MQKAVYLEFELATRSARYAAFKQMGRAKTLFASSSELTFYRALGTGGGSGFSVWPDFSRYAFLLVFKTGVDPKAFMESNDLLKWYAASSNARLLAVLQPRKAHGKWDGISPFEVAQQKNSSAPIAVLTRATVRPSRILEFWRNVPKVSAFMLNNPGVIYQSGVGEYPIFMQATFSLWHSSDAMRNAAYKATPHGKVVKLTRERSWYKEELFAEFDLLNVECMGDRYAEIGKLLARNEVKAH